MAARGRPLKTELREKIASILNQVGQSYGYEIYKRYQDVFGKISLRNLYYNIKKGTQLGEFIIIDIRQEIGNFTWGGATQHIYYTLGPYARLYQTTERQRELLAKLPKTDSKIDWDAEVNKKMSEMEASIKTYLEEEPRMLYEDKTKFKSTIKNQAKLLKEWMAARFERQKAHEIHLKIDEIAKKVD
jgi:hypothetical protein